MENIVLLGTETLPTVTNLALSEDVKTEVETPKIKEEQPEPETSGKLTFCMNSRAKRFVA